MVLLEKDSDVEQGQIITRLSRELLTLDCWFKTYSDMGGVELDMVYYLLLGLTSKVQLKNEKGCTKVIRSLKRLFIG